MGTEDKHAQAAAMSAGPAFLSIPLLVPFPPSSHMEASLSHLVGVGPKIGVYCHRHVNQLAGALGQRIGGEFHHSGTGAAVLHTRQHFLLGGGSRGEGAVMLGVSQQSHLHESRQRNQCNIHTKIHVICPTPACPPPNTRSQAPHTLPPPTCMCNASGVVSSSVYRPR